MRKSKNDITGLRHILFSNWKWLKLIGKYIANRIQKNISIEKPPIFIVGCGHSGTSILLNILGNHPSIYAIPYESKLAESKLSFLHRRCFNLLTICEGKSRWIEKTPQHIHSIDKLCNMEPECKIIIVLRDGRDAACSMQDRGGDIEYGITRWVNDNKTGEEKWSYSNVHILRYEELVTNTENTLKNCLKFIDEEYSENLINYHQTPAYLYSQVIEKPPDNSDQYQAQYRNWQINQPLFDGRGKWTRMTHEEKDLVKNLAGEMLTRYGYTSSNDW